MHNLTMYKQQIEVITSFFYGHKNQKQLII